MHLRRENALSLKRQLFPHGGRVKMLAQGFSDLFFDDAPHLEYIFQFFELSTTKAAFAKAAFDTLRKIKIGIRELRGQNSHCKDMPLEACAEAPST